MRRRSAVEQSIPSNFPKVDICCLPQIYINTAKEVGDVDHLKVFASDDAAQRWCAEHDPEGAAFEYPVEGSAS